MVNFTFQELSTIRCGLEVAVEEYLKLANHPKMNKRSAQQFRDQAKDAQLLVDKLAEEGY